MLPCYCFQWCIFIYVARWRWRDISNNQTQSNQCETAFSLAQAMSALSSYSNKDMLFLAIVSPMWPGSPHSRSWLSCLVWFRHLLQGNRVFYKDKWKLCEENKPHIFVFWMDFSSLSVLKLGWNILQWLFCIPNSFMLDTPPALCLVPVNGRINSCNIWGWKTWP